MAIGAHDAYRAAVAADDAFSAACKAHGYTRWDREALDIPTVKACWVVAVEAWDVWMPFARVACLPAVSL